jgi:hypothetical protein
MKAQLRLLVPFFAALALAFAGTTIAGQTPETSQAEPPIDCKMTPEHPRCKDKKN